MGNISENTVNSQNNLGFFFQLHKRQKAWIHPSSILHGTVHNLVLFTEIVQTTKCFLRQLTTIENDWLMEVAPEYFKQKNIRTSDE